jgi:hypothetical protein
MGGRYHLQCRALFPKMPCSAGPVDWATQGEFSDKTEALKARLERKRTHPSYDWRVFDAQADHDPGEVPVVPPSPSQGEG